MNSAAILLGFQLLTGIPGQVVELRTSLNDWDAPPIRMEEREPGAYVTSIQEPWTRFLQYKFVVDGRWLPDPRNPASVDDGHGGRNSIIETSFTEDPWLRPAAPKLPERTLRLPDWTGALRSLTIVAPQQAGCVALYFLDGGDYLKFTFARELLANLWAARGRGRALPCFAAIFVPPRDREGEDTPGAVNTAFARWLKTDVVPALESRTQSGGSPARRLVIGPSLGGLGAALVALREPDAFRRIASQSGSFWWEEREFLRLLEQATPAQLRGLELHLRVGNLEAPILLGANRALRDQLLARGIRHTYAEHPSQHDWTAWRNQLRQILTQAFSQ